MKLDVPWFCRSSVPFVVLAQKRAIFVSDLAILLGENLIDRLPSEITLYG